MPDLAVTSAGRMDAADPRQRLGKAARMFEQQFAAQILKPLSEPKTDDDPFANGDPGDAAFRGLLVDGLAEQAAGGLGIARLIEHQLAQRIRGGG